MFYLGDGMVDGPSQLSCLSNDQSCCCLTGPAWPSLIVITTSNSFNPNARKEGICVGFTVKEPPRERVVV